MTMVDTVLDGLDVLVRDCASSGVARRALLLRMDLLPPSLSRPHHLRLARAALDPLTSADRAQTHELPGRVAVSWRGDAQVLLRQSMAALGHLLHDCPAGAPSLADLVGLYDLPRDGDALLAAVGAASKPEPAVVPLLYPMDTTILSQLEQRLATADMARFARRRTVCRLQGDRMDPAWDRRFLSVAEVGAALAPGYALQADPWLFRRLTRVLDRRLLALLSDPGELDGAGPFSLGLNISSVLSPEFLRFDAALPPALRGRVVLELLPADVVADPAAFAFARDFARTRRYRLLLRGVTAALLPLLSVDRMEMDHVQVRWSPDLPPPCSMVPWVLSRTDSEAALVWGRTHGVTLFTGSAAARTA